MGHTFISLSHSTGGNTNTLVFGLYPLDGANPLSPETDRAIVDDGGHDYNVSYSFDLTCSDFNMILQEAIQIQGSNYNLNSNNCTDFGINLGNSIDLSIPDSQGTWGVGGGSNPGDLGEDLRTYNQHSGTISATPGTAPSTKCN